MSLPSIKEHATEFGTNTKNLNFPLFNAFTIFLSLFSLLSFSNFFLQINSYFADMHILLHIDDIRHTTQLTYVSVKLDRETGTEKFCTYIGTLNR